MQKNLDDILDGKGGVDAGGRRDFEITKEVSHARTPDGTMHSSAWTNPCTITFTLFVVAKVAHRVWRVLCTEAEILVRRYS